MNPIIFAVLVVAGIGLVLGVGLTVASVLLAVPVDEKAARLRENLPGANCGACGFSGCDTYAEAMSSGEAEPTLCIPGGADTAAKLAEICGADAGSFVSKAAFVRCNGDCGHTSNKLNYAGEKTCAAASMVFGGPGACGFGCIGFGDCVGACDYGAVSVVNGLARVNPLLCGGCGKCAAACPRKIIDILPVSDMASVRCSNTDKGAVARKVCSISCIGCKICEKKCPEGAISVNNNLAAVDPQKCTGCGICAAACPQKCIEMI